ncbi:MAG: dephospho-CoA kinase [Lachnospiraceae bacterium]|nr:dephospho-CoA kinase [Lachnospiraceae bacterium]
MVIIGITGGVGSGKSLVLNELRENYHAYIIEADKLAHTMMLPGNAIYNEIIDAFGKEILNDYAPYEIDRAKLGQIVFYDREKLNILNGIIHPCVKQEIQSQIQSVRENGTCSLFAIEAALLIEDGYKRICDEIWYVWVDRETRILRLASQRGYTREKCISMMDSQSSDNFYLENADYILNNNGDIKSLSKQINARLNILL